MLIAAEQITKTKRMPSRAIWRWIIIFIQRGRWKRENRAMRSSAAFLYIWLKLIRCRQAITVASRAGPYGWSWSCLGRSRACKY